MGKKLVMGSAFRNAVFRKYQYFFRIADGGKPVGNDKGGTVFGEFLQRILYDLFAFIIQSRGGFIKDQDRRVFQKKPLLWKAAAFVRRII